MEAIVHIYDLLSSYVLTNRLFNCCLKLMFMEYSELPATYYCLFKCTLTDHSLMSAEESKFYKNNILIRITFSEHLQVQK